MATVEWKAKLGPKESSVRKSKRKIEVADIGPITAEQDDMAVERMHDTATFRLSIRDSEYLRISGVSCSIAARGKRHIHIVTQTKAGIGTIS